MSRALYNFKDDEDDHECAITEEGKNICNGFGSDSFKYRFDLPMPRYPYFTVYDYSHDPIKKTKMYYDIENDKLIPLTISLETQHTARLRQVSQERSQG